MTDHSPEPTTTDESDPARPLLDGITLCMIVRDSSGTLRPCLESIRPWVDQMVVVDTGSLDDTREFAKSLGAEVHEFPWCDDFSAARNESLRHARHRWLFWMDSDDTIDAGNGKQLRDLAAAASPAEVLGFVVKVHCPSPAVDGQNDVTVVDHVKLFPNRPDLRFEGRIHEQILPALRRAGGKVVWTDLFVTHSGADLSTDGQRRKIERDLRILEREYAERPNHPFVLFNLGMTYNEAGRPELAARHLQRCLDVAGPDESHLRKVYALLIEAQCRLGREDLASETCRQGLARFPADPELLFRAATAHHRSRRWQEAAQAYQRVLASREEPHFSSLDYGILGYKTRQNLATVYGELGSWASAEGQWRLVLRERPLLEAAHLGLLDALLAQGRHTAAQAHVEALHRRADCDYSLPELLSVYLLEKSGQLEQARRRLDDALRVTDAPCLHRVRCRLAFEHGTLAEGITAHERLLAIETDDPAVHCNLGTLLLRDHRPAEAERCFRASLRLRPNSPLAYLHLGYARMAQGAQDEARTAWLTAAQMDPGAEGVLEAQALLAEGQGAAVTVHGEVA